MDNIIEIRATVRREMLDRVVCALKEAGVRRFTVTRAHAIGAGVDPASVKLSWDEGSEYADKAIVQFICGRERCSELVALIGRAAQTGRKGDGIVAVYSVENVLKIRTGSEGLQALR